MTHGEIKQDDWKNLITIRPGPVLHVWRDGSEFCNVPLTQTAALDLIGRLVAAMQVATGTASTPLCATCGLPNPTRNPYCFCDDKLTARDKAIYAAFGIQPHGVTGEDLRNGVTGKSLQTNPGNRITFPMAATNFELRRGDSRGPKPPIDASEYGVRGGCKDAALRSKDGDKLTFDPKFGLGNETYIARTGEGKKCKKRKQK